VQYINTNDSSCPFNVLRRWCISGRSYNKLTLILSSTGGTNSHVILSQTPRRHHQTSGISHANGISSHVNSANESTSKSIPRLFVLSAKSKISLIAAAANLREWLSQSLEDTNLQNLAYTLSNRRSLMAYRSAFLASSAESLHDVLQTCRITKVSSSLKIAWVFTGQGAQWPKMAQELIYNQTFGKSLTRSESILRSLGTTWSLIEEIQKEESQSRINESEISQPATTAIQIALIDLLRSFNVIPDAVLGHSSGEIAAAYGAGSLDQETALKISYHRSFISTWCREDVKQKGAMLAVGLGEDDVALHISKLQSGSCVVACVNSPSSTTVSGDQTAINELQQNLDQFSIFNRRLKVDTAYHSHHMRIVANRYLRSLGTIKTATRIDSIKFFSSVTGTEKLKGFEASYWVENLVSKVRFNDALQALAKSQSSDLLSTHIYIELGPHSALQGPIRQSLAELSLDLSRHLYYPTLVRDKHAQNSLLELAGKLYEQGYSIDLQAANTVGGAADIGLDVIYNLPSYAWNREKYWHESRLSREYRFREHPHHDLLGLRIAGGNILEPMWRNVLSIDTLPWLNEHIIDNFALFPGSGFLCMAIEAMRQILHDRKSTKTVRRFVMRDISFSKALVIPNSPGKIEVQLSFKQVSGSEDKSRTPWEEFCVTGLSQDGKTWNEHCRGSIMCELISTLPVQNAVQDDDFAETEYQDEEDFSTAEARLKLAKMQQNCVQNIDSASLYQELRENGIDYGNTFASISKLHIGPCQAIGTVVIPDIAACMPSNYFQPHVIHPATFDALMHIVLPLYSRHCSTGPVMLTSIEEVTVAADIFRTPGQELLVSCALSPAGTRSGTVNVSVFHGSEASETGPAVVTLTREEFRGLGSSASLSKNQILPKDIAYHVDWIAIPGYPADPDHSFNPIVIVQDTVDSSNGFASVISSIFQGFDIESTQVTLSSVDIEQGTTYLVIDTAPKPLLADPSLAQFSQINKIFSEAQLVIWTTVSDSYSTREIPENELIRGLARVARQEHKKLELFTLEIRSDLQDMPQLANVILNLVSTLSSWSRSGKSPLMDHDYIYSEGTLSVPRIVLNNCYNSFAAGKAENETFGMDLFHQEKRPLRIHVETPGLLESLQFVDDPDAIGEELCANVVAIKVYAHGVNQSDVSLALGRNGSQMIGECSGVITAMGVGVVGHRVGDRVLGWGSSSPYGSNMRMDYRLIHKLPESLSFIEGASIPYAFETAYYGLIEIANLQSGQSILIHSAAGGVGQAAIMLAKNIGAEIFLTVSSSNKRGMLAKTFGIPKKNIFSSRSKSFKQGIKRSTNGKGVDVVLNTITDSEMLHDTWECVSTFGTFINIAALAGQLSVKPFTSNVTFSSINMSLMAKHQPAKVGRILEKVMFMFEAKVLWPIHPIISMPMTQVVDAFKLIQYKKHNGKVVLTTDNSTMVKQTLLQTMSFQLEKSGNYVIAASDRQMVHPICRFMVAHGAEHIIVLVDSQDKKSALKIELDSFGANIRTLICDTTHQKRLKATIAGLGSIKGVVKVGSIECVRSSFRVFRCFYSNNIPIFQGGKSPLNAYEFQLPIDGTRFLAEALSESAIDFFIMISPISMALGLTNHGGYAAETAFQQAFAKSHVSSLTSFISLSIGCIETSGSHKFNDYAPKISIDEFNSLLEYSMGGKARLDGCHQILTGLDEASLRRHNLTTMDNPIFTSLQAATVSKPSRAIDSTKMTGQHLSMAKSVDEAQTMIAAALVEQLSSLVALDIEDITMNLPIADIGLDSLIAIEFKNWIGRNLSAAMQTSEILDAPNVGELAKLITSRSANVSNKLPKKCPEVDISEMGFLGSRSEQQNDAGHTTPPQSTSDQSIILTPISTTPSPMLKLPHQPLPELHSTLQFYLGSVRSFCSTKELEHTQSAIDEFLEPGGLGRLLQERLLTRYNDPNIQNWVAELYLASGFLERRVQLVPFSSFFFGHPHSEHPHTQAERATVISIAAFKYKQLLDGGQIQSEILNEQPTCMELYQWIFNTSRRPCIGVDVMDKFPGNDYLIALKNGRAFKVALTNGSGHVSYRELKVVFETILDTVDDSVSWAGILTSDERNSWAKVCFSFIPPYF
jgi:acyl transferase domain-containing protein/NADPH:quinone reductase-like Zn-dependent oxidoreductase/acyl carrier protein